METILVTITVCRIDLCSLLTPPDGAAKAVTKLPPPRLLQEGSGFVLGVELW